MIKIWYIIALLLLTGCSCRPSSPSYDCTYQHLKYPLPNSCNIQESDYYLVILVDARHLDYSNNRSFFKTLSKHPSDGSKNGDVGHAWIYVKGILNGQTVELEGGHSGELGILQPRYFDGVMNYIDYGYADPNDKQLLFPRYEPNPIKYLWETQKDGFFEKGAGYHTPNFAVKIDLTEERFHEILTFIANYDYSDYSIVENQCSSFVAQIAALAGLELESKVAVPVDQYVFVGGRYLCFWRDPCFSKLTISSPDIIERSLRYAVLEGRAEYALKWYLRRHRKDVQELIKQRWETVRRFPCRYLRYRAL